MSIGQVQHIDPGLATIQTAPDQAMADTGGVIGTPGREDDAIVRGSHAGHSRHLTWSELVVIHGFPGLGESGGERGEPEGDAEGGQVRGA